MSNPLQEALHQKDVGLFHQLIQGNPHLVYDHLNLDLIDSLKDLNYPAAELFIRIAFLSNKLTQSQLSLTFDYAMHQISQLLVQNKFEEAFKLIVLTIQGQTNIKPHNLGDEINAFALFFSTAYYQFYKGNIQKGVDLFHCAFNTDVKFPVLLENDKNALILRAFSYILPKLPANQISVQVYQRYLEIMRDTIGSTALGKDELSVATLVELLRLFAKTLNSVGRKLQLEPFIRYIEEKATGTTVTRIRLWDFAILYIDRLIKQSGPNQSEQEKSAEVEQCRMILTILNMIANIEFQHEFGCNHSLFTRAMATRHTLHIAKVLVNHGATCDLMVPMFDSTRIPLMSLMSTVGNLPGVQFLMEQGVNPNVLPSPLMAALLADHQDVALYLARHEKMDVNLHRGGMTPFMVASRLHYREVVKVLRARGAVEPVSQSMESATHDVNSRNQTTVPLLAPHPVRVVTPPRIQMFEQEPDAASQRRTMKDLILKNNCEALRDPKMRRFIHSPKSVDPTTGYHPIHTACELGADQALECLIRELKVEVNARNGQSYTALHMACESKRHSTIKVLVACGANTKVKTLLDMIPYDLADKTGQALLGLRKPSTLSAKASAATNGSSPHKNGKSQRDVRPPKPRAAVVVTKESSATLTPPSPPRTPTPPTPELVFPKYTAPARLIPIFKEVHQCLWRIRECQRFYRALSDSARWVEQYKQAVFPLIREFFVALQEHHESTLETKMIPYPLLGHTDPLIPNIDRFQSRCNEYLLTFFETKLSLTLQDTQAKQILQDLTEADVSLCTEAWVDGLLKSCEDSRAPLTNLSAFLHQKSNGNVDNSMVKSRLC